MGTFGQIATSGTGRLSAAVAAAAILLIGCSPGGFDSGGGTGGISAQVVWPGDAILAASAGQRVSPMTAPAGVANMRFTVSGGPVTTPVVQTFAGSLGVGTMNNIPSGSGISLKIDALDAGSVVIYTGTKTAITVSAGSNTTAVVPMAASGANAANDVPFEPTDVTATAGNGQVQLNWTAVANATSYNVYWGPSATQTRLSHDQTLTNFPPGNSVLGTTTNGVLTSLVDRTAYYFTVTAVNANGESTESPTVSATPLASLSNGSVVPGIPIGVQVVPGSGQNTLSWPAVPGATDYAVYYGSTLPLGSTSAPTGGPATYTASIPNGILQYYQVTAHNTAGDSGRSNVVCGVPTAGGGTTGGFDLLDGLCGTALDGTLWVTPVQSRTVAPGQLTLTVAGSNQEARGVRGTTYQNLMSVNPGAGNRVTALQADVTVPSSALAAQSGGSDTRAVVRLLYQPPAFRLNFPGGNQHLIVAQVQLRNVGSGLIIERSIALCTTAACGTPNLNPVTYVDGTFPQGQAASYNTPYTLSVSLNESTGVFTYSVAGGSISGTATGTANASSLFTSEWNGLSVDASTAFFVAQIGVRTLDGSTTGTAGGGSGTMTATFANVKTATATGSLGATPTALAMFDNFSYVDSGSNAAIDPAKWGTLTPTVAMPGSGLLVTALVTTATGAFAAGTQFLSFGQPALGAISQIKVDATITAESPNVAAGSSEWLIVEAAFYNDGKSGATANSAIGDIRAFMELNQTGVIAIVLECSTATCSSGTVVNTLPITVPLTAAGAGPACHTTAPVFGVGKTHALLIMYNGSNQNFTFQVDDCDPSTPFVPTGSYALASPTPNAIFRSIGATATIGAGAVAGSTGSITGKVNNLFVQ